MSRLVARKDHGRNIAIAFPGGDAWHVVEHDWILAQDDRIARSASWRNKGLYSWPRLSGQWLELLAPFRLDTKR